MTLLSQYLHIHFQFKFILFIFLQFNALLIFNNQWNHFIFKHRGKLFFYFLFCSLCSLLCSEVHSDVRNVVVCWSFSMLFLRACSPTSSESPSMFWALSFSSFNVFCPKGSCFSLVISFLPHTHFVLRVPVFLWCASSLQKLPLHHPLLSQLSAWCLVHWLWSCPWLSFAILVVFRCHRFKWCDPLFFHLPVACLFSLKF